MWRARRVTLLFDDYFIRERIANRLTNFGCVSEEDFFLYLGAELHYLEDWRETLFRWIYGEETYGEDGINALPKALRKGHVIRFHKHLNALEDALGKAISLNAIESFTFDKVLYLRIKRKVGSLQGGGSF